MKFEIFFILRMHKGDNFAENRIEKFQSVQKLSQLVDSTYLFFS